MKHALAIFKWEINKIIGNWQKAATIFLLPAAIMVFAINLFPQLLNYLATGEIGSQRVIVVNAPESFMDYDGKHTERYSYSYEDWDYDELMDASKFQKAIKNGRLLVIFVNYEDFETNYKNFDDGVSKYYKNLLAGDTISPSSSIVTIIYDEHSYYLQSKAEQFKVDIMDKYTSSLVDVLGGKYSELSVANINTDGYNPISYIMGHRSVANFMAARVVSGILGLLMYYCVYSLTLDMLAQEKNRGFLAKLKMSPVSPVSLLGGKLMAIVGLVSVSGLVTFLFLFFSSWLNRSNDAASLLPFGMLLTPGQLIYLILAIPSTAFVLSIVCFDITLSLERFNDIVANLQIPLMLFLVDFFIQLILPGAPILPEYMIPGHNLIAITRGIFLSEINIGYFLVAIITNLLVSLMVYRDAIRKFSEDIAK